MDIYMDISMDISMDIHIHGKPAYASDNHPSGTEERTEKSNLNHNQLALVAYCFHKLRPQSCVTIQTTVWA